MELEMDPGSGNDAGSNRKTEWNSATQTNKSNRRHLVAGRGTAAHGGFQTGQQKGQADGLFICHWVHFLDGRHSTRTSFITRCLWWPSWSSASIPTNTFSNPSLQWCNHANRGKHPSTKLTLRRLHPPLMWTSMDSRCSMMCSLRKHPDMISRFYIFVFWKQEFRADSLSMLSKESHWISICFGMLTTHRTHERHDKWDMSA